MNNEFGGSSGQIATEGLLYIDKGQQKLLAASTNDKLLVMTDSIPAWKASSEVSAIVTNPMTAAGDLIVGGVSGTPTKLTKGADGKVLLMTSGSVGWGTNAPVAGGNDTEIQYNDGGTTSGLSSFTLSKSSGMVNTKFLTVQPAGTAGPAITARRGTVGQTENIFQLQAQDNSALAAFEADGTLVFSNTATVYDDVQWQIQAGKNVTGLNVPTWETFTANTMSWSFAVDDFFDLPANEPMHGWKEGSDASFHIHLATKAANNTGSDRFAKFTIYIGYADVNGVYTEAQITNEKTIPTGTSALTHLLLSLGNLTLTGYRIGTQLRVRIKRIAATGGTEYSGNIFITQVGAHFENDTIGSRSVATK